MQPCDSARLPYTRRRQLFVNNPLQGVAGFVECRVCGVSGVEPAMRISWTVCVTAVLIKTILTSSSQKLIVGFPPVLRSYLLHLYRNIRCRSYDISPRETLRISRPMSLWFESQCNLPTRPHVGAQGIEPRSSDLQSPSIPDCYYSQCRLESFHDSLRPNTLSFISLF